MTKSSTASQPMEVDSSESKVIEEVKSTVKFTDVVNIVLYILKGVELNQPRLLNRAIRQNASVRKYVTAEQLDQLIKKYIPPDWPTYNVMMDAKDKIPATEVSEEEKEGATEMEVDDPASSDFIAPVTSVVPEVEVYIFNLIVTTLLRNDTLTLEAAAMSKALIDRIKLFNRRSLDPLSSKAYFYFSLAHEKINQLDTIRPTLLELFRTACIRHDEMGQAVLFNLLLHNYLTFNLVDQAHTLSLRATFPENASNNQFCRYLYYMGRIQAIQMEYTESYQRLMMAARKAPQGYAVGFSRMVHKLAVIVQLLMGDIPERSLFNQKELAVALKPYFILTQAVRTGDLILFGQAAEQYSEAFMADKTFSLVRRLRHNVIKTGLRKISVSYSRISLADIAEKLHLPSASAAEYICAKAIRDGVIEARIDNENGWLSSQEVLDHYSTEEPQKAFHKRIAFCLDVHNDAVKSMRYPPDETYRKELEKLRGGDRKRDSDKQDEKTIEELIKEMEDEMDE